MSILVALAHATVEIESETVPDGDSREDETVGLVVGLFLVVSGYCILLPHNRNCSAGERSPVRRHTAWFAREGIALLIRSDG